MRLHDVLGLMSRGRSVNALPPLLLSVTISGFESVHFKIARETLTRRCMIPSSS